MSAMRYSSLGVVPLLLIALILVSLISLLVGPFGVDFEQALQGLSAFAHDRSNIHLTTITELRMPRVIVAIIVGSSLAVAGVVMQGLFRNPLADPGLAGTSSGAALFASAAIVFGLSSLHPLVVPLLAFIGAMVTTSVILLVHYASREVGVISLLLAGVAINAIAGAGMGALSYIADDFALRSMTFWQFGSLGKMGWDSLLWPSLVATPAVIWLLCQARVLNALLLGEGEAHHLGINVQRLRWQLLLAVSLCVGAAVAAAGLIGFIGLVVPHALRLILGPNHRLLLPAALFVGPAFLLIADMIARVCVAPAELPIGILTSLVGGPFFLYLVIGQLRR